MNTTIYFIRHGQTSSNAHGIQQGAHIDEYLDTQGILEVERLGKLAAHLQLDLILTSYLHRAEETAAILEKYLPEPIPLLHDFRLHERDFGSLNGKTLTEWDALVPNHRELEEMQMYDYHAFGGESVSDVRQRALSAILDISQNYDHKNIGIVTHAGIIRLMLFHFPEIIRVYHDHIREELDISNTDIYEWQISENDIATVKSLLN